MFCLQTTGWVLLMFYTIIFLRAYYNPSFNLTNIFGSALFLGRNSEQDWLHINQVYKPIRHVMCAGALGQVKTDT